MFAGIGALLWVLSRLGVYLATRPPRPPRKATMTTPTPDPFDGLRDTLRDTGRLFAAWKALSPRPPLSREAVIGLVLGLLGLGFAGILWAMAGAIDVYKGTARGKALAVTAVAVNALVNLAWFLFGVMLVVEWIR